MVSRYTKAMTTNENPLSQYRSLHNRSLADAAKDFGVSITYIRRVEQGVFPELSPDFIQKLSDMTGTSELRLGLEYHRWIEMELTSVELPIIPLSRDTTVREWRIWAGVLCDLNDIDYTVYGIAKLLKINPAILTKWENGKMDNIPAWIIERIQQIHELQGGH